MALTARLTRKLVPFLEDHRFFTADFGQHVILQDHKTILAKLKRLESKKSREVLMVKFAPDYLCAHESKPEDLFFLDAKASITPNTAPEAPMIAAFGVESPESST